MAKCRYCGCEFADEKSYADWLLAMEVPGDSVRRVTIERAGDAYGPGDAYGSGIPTWIVQQPIDDFRGTHALVEWDHWRNTQDLLKGAPGQVGRLVSRIDRLTAENSLLKTRVAEGMQDDSYTLEIQRKKLEIAEEALKEISGNHSIPDDAENALVEMKAVGDDDEAENAEV